MFRLAGWRLAVVASMTPLLQKASISKKTKENATVQPAKRRIGTVVSFMHRRGYGFIRELESSPAKKKKAHEAAAVAPADADAPGSSAITNFFFPRSSLDGGFYLSEGQTVAFDVRLTEPGKNLKARLAEADISSSTASASSTPLCTDGTDVEVDGEGSKKLTFAHRIRLYDARGGQEKPVTPIMLVGYVESWDQLAGKGVIAELDLSGRLNEDAPRFTVGLEDLDLAGHSELRRGRYVRFCLESGDRTAARRVIIDRGAERKHAAQLSAAAEDQVDGNEGRQYGTVREIVEGRFGFILLDDTGESVFFHMSNAEGGGVKQGDTVSFIMREVTQGKHAGKRTCLRVRRCTARNFTSSAGAAAGNGQKSRAAQDLDDDDDFELLE
ncbi:hypothetical protein MOQ_008727 [Trypanosoma cruzi marinkellei]|uniref:CSD domain-containing protein n=1 Tax=Trypanosoma cruzi marinkellei TaxID=85056 RepID=K2NEY1_TRYCR|nr:hypothetical protein MOQ_008727 [Trypanosoma cruzi marinkellei]